VKKRNYTKANKAGHSLPMGERKEKSIDDEIMLTRQQPVT
jgi:hypothetical protein